MLAKGCVAFVVLGSNGGRGAEGDMARCFFELVTEGASVGFPKLPSLHHFTHTTLSGGVFGCPQAEQGRRAFGGCSDGVPVDAFKGFGGKYFLLFGSFLWKGLLIY